MDHLVQEAYICRTIHGHVVVFARFDNEVRICKPNDLQQSSFKTTLEEWMKIKKSYHNPSHLVDNDVINAAWQSLGSGNLFDKNAVKELKSEMGRYSPRIWRGIYDRGTFYCYKPIDARGTYGAAYVGANVAISSIFELIEDVFMHVAPARDNLSTFGHKIREALILACTEVESAWRSVLEANSSTRKASYSTNDYIRLVEPLRLREWSVVLKNYPELGKFSPFASWDDSKPTKSLIWYDSYNAAKHYREEKFQEANLGSLVNAAAALHVIQAAQFGPEMYDRFFGNERSPFFTSNHPSHDLSELYTPSLSEGAEISAKLFFG